MSTTMQLPVTAWQTRPGWGIAVDLTPREVLQSRQVRVHKRLIGLSLGLVLILCAGVALLVLADRASAQRSYDQEQARTAQLAAAADPYAVITTMQTVTARVRTDLASVMGQDVDIVNLMAFLKAARPEGLNVTDQAVLLSPPVAPTPVAPADGTAPGAAPAPVDAAPQTIGSVTIAGTGPSISAINPFVSRLNRIRGVIDVVPTSVTQTETGMSYTISMNITDELYTGRYDGVGAP